MIVKARPDQAETAQEPGKLKLAGAVVAATANLTTKKLLPDPLNYGIA